MQSVFRNGVRSLKQKKPPFKKARTSKMADSESSENREIDNSRFRSQNPPSSQQNSGRKMPTNTFIACLFAIKGWIIMKWQAVKDAYRKQIPKGKRHKRKTKDSFSKEKLFFSFNVGYNVIRNLFIALIVLLIIGIAFAGGTGLGYFAYLVSGEEVPSFEKMQEDINNVSTTSSMYYGSGEKISDLRTDLKRTTVSLDNISDLVPQAVIATEDEYFYEHDGVVPKAVARALLQEVTGTSSTSGGSTLTQQLVKQQILSNEVSFARKANEILLAYRLENYFTKEEIMEAYLNVSPFGRNNRGENIAGIQEAALGIFGINADELSLPQAAFIAGLPQNPIVYSPYTQYGEIKEDLSSGMNRKDDVLFNMYRENYISETEYNEALSYDLAQDFIQQEEAEVQTNSYVYNAVEKEARNILIENLYTAEGFTEADIEADQNLYNHFYEQADQDLRMNGYTINSTIDKPIYDAMQESVAQNASSLGVTREIEWTDPDTDEVTTIIEPAQTSSVLQDNATGRIIAFVGGVDFDLSEVNRAFDTERSPGSTIKPLVVFAPAFEQNIITPASMVYESAVIVPSTNAETGLLEEHRVTNVGNVVPDKWTSVREGLADSSNIIATKIYEELIGNDQNTVGGAYLPLMGIGTDTVAESEYSNASFAIGATQYTNLQNTNAFAMLANNGVYTEAYLIESIEDANGEAIYQHESTSTQVFSPETAYLTIDLMRDVMDNGTAADIEGQLLFSADIAGKTGTSESQKDIWFVGSTPQVTLSSWIGYDNALEENYMDDSSGSGSGSSRNRAHWARLMNAIYRTNPTIIGTDRTFQQPAGIQTDTVLAETGMKSGTVRLPDGREVTAGGDTKSEIFNRNFIPGTTVYDFAIGASDEELQDYWRQLAEEEDSESDDSDNENDDDANNDDNEDNDNNEDGTDDDNNNDDDNDDDDNEDDDGGNNDDDD